MKSIQVLSSLLLLPLAVASCGASSAEPAVPEGPAQAEPTATAAEAPPAPAAPTAWSADMTTEQKIAFMVDRVVPAMKPVFAGASDFGCATCHGAEQTNAQQFAHPNQALPGLTFENGHITSFATNPDVSKFMAEKVLPAMAEVMGRPTYSEQTPDGMGCNGCHAVAMK